MRARITLLLFAILYSFTCLAQTNFEKHFTKKSLRIDFALSGNWDFQAAAIQQLREEPVWAGPVKNLIDPFGYGGYYINVYDKAGKELIYSRGFNTLFEEWRSTEQAKTETQSWTNSISIPYPKAPVIIEITARDKADMQFHPLLKQEIDPASIFIDRGKLKENRITKIRYNGDSSGKVDLVFLAEGYTADEQEKFVADAKRFTEALFKTPPYDTRREDFNVWAVDAVSEESGTDVSGKGIFKNTALNSGYYTFGVDRYLTTPDMKSIRDAVWNAPCDAIFILVNTDAYGGGGMYNFYAMKYEPWEPNITTLVNFDAKWKDLLPTNTPIPTPLDDAHKDKAGVFEGGGYIAKGIYRPMDHCMMRDYAPFCPACSRAILKMIDYFTDKPIKH